ncbi:MAG TPA: hypothetical protein VJL84_09070 [Kiloniellales bacterium]|nr:hypothetical protein [Kiloniellales bacterium]
MSAAGGLSAAPRREADWIVAALALGAGAILLLLLHDRFWWAPDEGVYGFVAQQLLHGARLHADIQDLHPGYVQLLGAGALWLFGEDLVSLRYPLVALALVVAALVNRALAPRGAVPAALGTLVACALTLPLFLNPTANWYAVLLSIGLAALLSRAAAPSPLLLGFAVGLVFLFRQLTGVFLAAAVLLWLCDSLRRADRGARPGWSAPLALFAAAAVLALYLAGQAVGLAWLLFGIWPLALLLLGALRLRPADRLVLPALARLLVGALLAALPLALWHGLEGSLGAWLRDSFLTPWRIAAQDFLAFPGYTELLADALAILGAPADAAQVLSALNWLVLLALPAAVGLTSLLLWRRSLERPDAPALPPLLLFAPFVALVAVHYQIPVYLFFALGALWLALLSVGRGPVQLVAALSLVLTLWTQAAQPLTRPLEAVVAGRRLALDAPQGLPRASLAMQAEEQRLYQALLAAIEEHSTAEQPILALPMNPELYFLSGRRPPVRFFASQLGLAQPADLGEALASVAARPPVLLIHRPDDKYNGPLSDQLLAALLPHYRSLEPIGPFRLYLRSSSSASRTAPMAVVSELSRTR